MLLIVMAALVGIHAQRLDRKQDVDGRVKPGHDDIALWVGARRGGML